MGSHRQSNIGGWINLEWIHFRYDLRAEQSPWLEYGNCPALRTSLAGLIGIGTAFGSEKDESPPWRQMRRSFGHGPTSTVRADPLVRPRWMMADAAALRVAQEVGHVGVTGG